MKHAQRAECFFCQQAHIAVASWEYVCFGEREGYTNKKLCREHMEWMEEACGIGDIENFDYSFIEKDEELEWQKPNHTISITPQHI